MVWILDHWLVISAGLVDPPEGAVAGDADPGRTSRSREKGRSKSMQIDQASFQAGVDNRRPRLGSEEHIKIPSLLEFEFPAKSGAETSPPRLFTSQDGSDMASLYSSQDCKCTIRICCRCLT